MKAGVVMRSLTKALARRPKECPYRVPHRSSRSCSKNFLPKGEETWRVNRHHCDLDRAPAPDDKVYQLPKRDGRPKTAGRGLMHILAGTPACSTTTARGSIYRYQGATVTLFSTFETPGADHAACSASSFSCHEWTLPRNTTLLSVASTLIWLASS